MANGDLAVSLPFVPGGELENQPAPDPPEAAPECRCRLWASETPLRDGRTSCNIGRGQREMTRTGSGAQQTVDRREVLRRAALLLGGALSAPTVAGVLAGCQAARGPDSGWAPRALTRAQDRKSTRLNSSHLVISYAVFCLKKKKISTSGGSPR